MIQEDRVRIMTKLADYEQKKKEDLKIARDYYRSDYIGICLLKNFLRISAAYIIGLILWAGHSIEAILEKLNAMEIRSLGIGILISYIVIVGAFLVLTYVLGTMRFYYAEEKLHTYRNLLKRLVKTYEAEEHRTIKEDRGRESENQGGTSNDGTH